MLVFSIFCLLKAAAPLKVEHVRDQIYKNQQYGIAAFADNLSKAANYAGILHANQQTSETTVVNRTIGEVYVDSAYQTREGWIVKHSRSKSQTDLMFNSYVPSAVTSWRDLEAKIGETLANYMRDYKVAFPSMALTQAELTHAAKALADQLERISKQPIDEMLNSLNIFDSVVPQFQETEAGMKQLLCCVAGVKIIRDKLEKALDQAVQSVNQSSGASVVRIRNLYSICCIPMTIVAIEKRQEERARLQKITGELIYEVEIEAFSNSVLGQKMIALKCALHNLNASSISNELETEMKRVWGSLLDTKAKENGCFVFDARNDQEFHALCLTKTPQALLDYLKSQVRFFNVKNNGSWGTQNCFFASIAKTPDALERIIAQFMPTEATCKRPKDKTWEEYWPEGGSLIREAIFKCFEEETDLELVKTMRGKESNLVPTQSSIVSKYQRTRASLPLWLHDYICQKVPKLTICCFIQPDITKQVLVAQAEVDLKRIDSQTVYVLNQLDDDDRAAIARGNMPKNAGSHYDGLQLHAGI
ncbi:MAG: hypothetical protein AAB323_00095 [Pseudomonadota bacterium]